MVAAITRNYQDALSDECRANLEAYSQEILEDFKKNGSPIQAHASFGTNYSDTLGTLIRLIIQEGLELELLYDDKNKNPLTN